jgi:SAM-dependent methyltransferase
VNAARRVVEMLATGRYAFLDAGCGEGISIGHLQERFGRGPGFGIDVQAPLIETAIANGYDAACCDLLQPDLVLPPNCVDFAAAMDVLEHLPTERDAAIVLQKLVSAAREFVFIRHPSFEDVDYLASLGLKLNWTDWTGHPNGMRIEDFRRLFAEFDWRDYAILPHMIFVDSLSHPSMLPLATPIDSVRYDPDLHGPRPAVTFDRPVYGKFDIFIRCGEMDPAVWARTASVAGWESVWDL